MFCNIVIPVWGLRKQCPLHVTTGRCDAQAPAGVLPATRVRIDVGNHAAIEDGWGVSERTSALQPAFAACRRAAVPPFVARGCLQRRQFEIRP